MKFDEKFLEGLGLSKEQIDSILTLHNDTVKTTVKDLEKNHTDEVKKITIANAVENALVAKKSKNLTATKSLLDFDKISIDSKGAVVGLDEQLEKLLADTSTNFLFELEVESTKETKEPETNTVEEKLKGFVPGSNGEVNKGGVTKDQFKSMSYKERAALHNTDIETYNRLSTEV